MFDPGQMSLLEDFGMRYLRGDLPPWWYAVWPLVQVVGLYKSEEQVSIRPIGIRNPLQKTFCGEVVLEAKEDFRAVLEPQQLGFAQGGAGKLVHATRMLLESNETNDAKNAYNENARASAV